MLLTLELCFKSNKQRTSTFATATAAPSTRMLTWCRCVVPRP